ncbi:MAG: excisionase family DNA-binding protein [Gordonibacter sp.]
MFSLTVDEAAERLGVGRARIYQLIRCGGLSAEKVAKIWLVDDQSVEARRAAAPKVGRPIKSKSTKTTVKTYTLMNRTHEVLTFCYDDTVRIFSDAGEIVDAQRAPFGLVSPRGRSVSAKALEYWWKHRSIPRTRKGLESKLAQLGLEAAAQIPFKSLGLSLSDQYWVRPQDCVVEWSDINYFENDFTELSDEGDWLADVGLDSPDNTSEGELPKKWICKGGKRVLLKGGTVLGQEPYNEVVATKLFERVLELDEYVPYRLRAGKGDPACQCECFVSSVEEYVPAYYVRQLMRQPNHRSDYQHYLDCCAELGVDEVDLALSKMIVCDDILGNTDRHWRNFGIVRNVETLECRIAPLFDTGTSLWCKATLGSFQAGDFSFATKPFYEDANRQLRLVNDYSWFDPDALDGFADEVAGVLAENPALVHRVDYVCSAVQGRIDRIVRRL